MKTSHRFLNLFVRCDPIESVPATPTPKLSDVCLKTIQLPAIHPETSIPTISSSQKHSTNPPNWPSHTVRILGLSCTSDPAPATRIPPRRPPESAAPAAPPKARSPSATSTWSSASWAFPRWAPPSAASARCQASRQSRRSRWRQRGNRSAVVYYL